jgi:catalase
VPEHPKLAEDLVATATEMFGTHAGVRTLHAKGVFCDATFTATPRAAELCRAAHFRGEPVPALVRFSNGGGNPHSNDANREAHGIAVKLRPPGADENDILGTTTPAFVLRTPESFLELLRLRLPDSETGEADMEALGKFLGEHPEAQTAIAGTAGVEPPASLAKAVYYSPHSFRLLDTDGNGTWIRYRLSPEAGEERIPDDEAQAKGRDYLFEDLAERLQSGPIGFELLFQLPAEDDPIDDPTALWPDGEFVEAGRLEITAVAEDPEHDGHIDVFDPTRVGDGIELSDDPILRIRHDAYSVSAYKRLG